MTAGWVSSVDKASNFDSSRVGWFESQPGHLFLLIHQSTAKPSLKFISLCENDYECAANAVLNGLCMKTKIPKPQQLESILFDDGRKKEGKSDIILGAK